MKFPELILSDLAPICSPACLPTSWLKHMITMNVLAVVGERQ